MTTPDPDPGSEPRAQVVASSQHEDTPAGFGVARSGRSAADQGPALAAVPSITEPRDPAAAGPQGVGVELIYWAGAKAIAGAGAELWPVDTIAAALKSAAAQRQDPRFDQLLKICSILVDGQVVHAAALDQQLQQRTRAEILPPFAGG